MAKVDKSSWKQRLHVDMSSAIDDWIAKRRIYRQVK
jgi:hypothetical protein